MGGEGVPYIHTSMHTDPNQPSPNQAKTEARTHPRGVVPDEDVARVERREDPWLRGMDGWSVVWMRGSVSKLRGSVNRLRMCVCARPPVNHDDDDGRSTPTHDASPFIIESQSIGSIDRSINQHRTISPLPTPSLAKRNVPPRPLNPPDQLTSTGCKSTDLMRSDRAVSFFFTSSRSGCWLWVIVDGMERVSVVGVWCCAWGCRGESDARTMVAAGCWDPFSLCRTRRERQAATGQGAGTDD